MARGIWVGGMSRMNLPAADPQLELSAVEFRPTVQKLRPQHLLIPLSGLLPIADLDIDVLYHRNPGHSCTSCRLRFVLLTRFPSQDAVATSIASGMKAVSSGMVATTCFNNRRHAQTRPANRRVRVSGVTIL